MKKITFLILVSLGFLTTLRSQTHLLPQAGPTFPIGNFQSQNLNADQGLQYGIHLDKLWKKFGLGIYVGAAKNNINYENPIPNDINGDNFRSRIFNESNQYHWQSYQAAIGPVLNLNLSKKIKIQLFTKAGLAKINYPDYRIYVDVNEPIQQEFTLFETKNEEATDNFNVLLISGLRLHFDLSKNIGLSFSGDYTHLRAVTHAYSYLDENLSLNSSESEILETLQGASTITEIRKCHFNSIGLNVGIIFRFNKKDKTKIPKEEPLVDRTSLPQTKPETPYECERIEYLSPGFNDAILLKEKSIVTFNWEDTNNAIAEKVVQHELVLYFKKEGNYQKVFSKKIKGHQLKVDLNKLNGILNNEIFWEINPIRNTTSMDTCPFENKKMRLQVFETKEEAEKKLPECKLE